MARETGGTERRDRGGGKELRKRVRHGKTGGRKEKRREVSRAGAITQISGIWRPRALAQTAILISTSKTHTPLTSHCTYILSFSPQTDSEGNEQSRTALPCCPISPQLYSQSIKLRTDGHLLPRSESRDGHSFFVPASSLCPHLHLSFHQVVLLLCRGNHFLPSWVGGV